MTATKSGFPLFALLAGATFISFSAPAHATDKVYAPYVDKGEFELEWRGGYDFDDNEDKDGAWKQKLAVGYGITDYWFSEIYGELEREGESGANTEFTAIEWENRFQLTEQGQYWLDAGILTELEYNTNDGPDKAEIKALFAKDTGKLSHIANIGAEREFGDHSGNDTEFGVSWSSRYRYRPEFEPGFEIHSDFGSLSDGSSFNEEKHRIGPVIYGSIGHFSYDVGYLAGVSGGAADGTLKAILEYEWYF